MAADVLTSSKTIAQAIAEGGWASKSDAEEEKKDERSGSEDLDDDRAENKMVQSILKNQNVSQYIFGVPRHTTCVVS